MNNLKNLYRSGGRFLTPLVICVVIFLPELLPVSRSAPAIVLFAVAISIVTSTPISHGFLRTVWPLIGIVVLGVLNSANHDWLDILRDLTFSLAPISLIYIGCWIADRGADWDRVIRLIARSGILFAVFYLFQFLQHPELIGASLGAVREQIGLPNSLFVFALALAFQKPVTRPGEKPTKLSPGFIALLILLATFLQSYSRTSLFSLLIFSLALRGMLSRFNTRTLITTTLIALALFFVGTTTPPDEVGTFRSKLARTFTEVSVENYADQVDLNSNWRGFETYRVLETFNQGDVLQKAFGQGFGALADLGFYMTLGDRDYHYISVMHNGYAYILLKTGVVGILLYIWFYLNIVRMAIEHACQRNQEIRFLARILLGSVLSLVAVMYVIGGMAEMADPGIIMMLGFLTRTIRRKAKLLQAAAGNAELKNSHERVKSLTHFHYRAG